jgi:hypothetical protein
MSPPVGKAGHSSLRPIFREDLRLSQATRGGLEPMRGHRTGVFVVDSYRMSLSVKANNGGRLLSLHANANGSDVPSRLFF